VCVCVGVCVCVCVCVCEFYMLDTTREVFCLMTLYQNPELVARLEKIQAQVDSREYNRMVKNVDVSVSVIIF